MKNIKSKAFLILGFCAASFNNLSNERVMIQVSAPWKLLLIFKENPYRLASFIKGIQTNHDLLHLLLVEDAAKGRGNVADEAQTLLDGRFWKLLEEYCLCH